MQTRRVFLLCSEDPILKDHLEELLQHQGQLIMVSLKNVQDPTTWQPHAPDLCFLDFIDDESHPEKFALLADVSHWLTAHSPQMPLVALGSMHHASSAIHALRCGVKEFLDPGLDEEVLATTQRLLTQEARNASVSHPNPQAKHIVILGARPGVGATTLSIQLAAMRQDQLHHGLENKTLLLDMGWPYADSLAYLGLNSQFRLDDALHNLQRLDQTLLKSALAQTKNELSVLSLPSTSNQLMDYSSNEIQSLIYRLTQYYSYVITDLGVTTPAPLFTAYLDNSDAIWLITDQSITSLVSVTQVLEQCQSEHRSKIKLIINKYDPQAGLLAQTIAEQFNLELLCTLPDQRQTLLQLSSQGKLMTAEQHRNPYYKALLQLCRLELLDDAPSVEHTSPWFKRLLNKRS